MQAQKRDDDDTALMASLSFRKPDDEDLISAVDCESPQQISAAPRQALDEIRGDNGDDSEDDFEFVLGEPETDPRISAEDVFSSGKIRLVYPVFGRRLVHEGSAPGGGATEAEKETKVLVHSLQHLFLGEREANETGSVSEDDEEVELSDIPEVPPGSYRSWAPGSSASSPAQCKKSNSTGSLLRWRIKDLVMGRSHSDGKEKFVFLAAEKRDPENKDEKKASDAVAFKEKHNWSGNLHRRSSHDERTPAAAAEKDKKKQTKGRRGGGKVAETGMTITHRLFYENANRQAKGGPRRSFLPYKQEVLGLFTGVNVLSRTYHPI